MVTDVLAEHRPAPRPALARDARVVVRHLERPAGRIATAFAAGIASGASAQLVPDEPPMADRRQRQCRAVMPIDFDRLLEQIPGPRQPALA